MQSRRHDDYVPLSPSSKTQSRRRDDYLALSPSSKTQSRRHDDYSTLSPSSKMQSRRHGDYLTLSPSLKTQSRRHDDYLTLSPSSKTQSRRHDDYLTLSPSSKTQSRRHDDYVTQSRYDVGGRDAYPVSRRGGNVQTSPRFQQRSLSPHRHGKVDGFRRIGLREGTSGSPERRNYGWHLGPGRTERVRSRSPSYILEPGEVSRFDEGTTAHRKYDYADGIEYNGGKNNKLKHVYGYDNDYHGLSSRMGKEKDYGENRILNIDSRVMMGQKSMPMDDVIMRVSRRPSPDPTSNYDKSGVHLHQNSRYLGISQFEHEKRRYQEPVSPDNRSGMNIYKEGENPMNYSRDNSYTMKPASHSKDFGSPNYKDFAGTSSGNSRSGFPSSFWEGTPISASGEYLRNKMKLTEPMDFNTYGHRPSLDMKNLERTVTGYTQGIYSPNRTEHDDFVYTKSQQLGNDDNNYPSVDLHRMVPSQSRVDHDQAHADYNYGGLSRMSSMHPVTDKVDPVVDSYRSMRNSSIRNHSMHKPEATENIDTRRMLYSPKNSEQYMGAGYDIPEFGRGDSRDDESSHLGELQNQQISHLRSDYGFGRDAGPQFQKERIQDPVMSMYDSAMNKFSGKRLRMEEEFSTYEQSNKVYKRTYTTDEDIVRHDPRTRIVSNRQYAPQEHEDAYENGMEWIEEEVNALRPSRTLRLGPIAHRMTKRTYDSQDHYGDNASQDWSSSQDSFAHSRNHSIRDYKPNVKFTKCHPRTGSLTWYNSHHTDKRIGVDTRHKTWKRNDDDDDHANFDDPSEDWSNMADSDIPEDSDKFKQLVHEAYLVFSKKLNLDLAARRRYKEQGKAGSLFCIVCGKRTSKEFMDTRRLVTHAFMSHKAGLRALHLGLHKAICVLMGWNTYVPCDTKTWVPDVLSDAEALAQKEDLMLWPPLVIMHNISMSINNPEQQKVIPIEGVEAFLRSNGFVGGKIKVCLGKPADQSVMLVKLLGTFTGLGIAKRLDRYFSENNRGRGEFEQKTSKSSKSSNDVQIDINGDKLEEHLLYGYIGISDDMDKLDFNTKKWITLKSKKDIQDLENAPLKTDDR
ncbi:uncharacterized protein LOC126660830 [Mercurialis annua]|uniref:uncharacterized protein LOC126660830 n=1 Tax=Mercurialis annua TaxID=3986 RepID=UPI0021610987|nr:uncharacterized protein LOC126660830 [Mercurialis annua]